MSAAIALILLAEAASSCAPAGAARLGGGAVLVRPVGTFAPAPFERLGPAASVVAKSQGIRQTGAPSEAEEPDADPPAEQCETAVTIA